MDPVLVVIIFIFGTIVGSFLNVVIYRYNSGTSPLTGRSQCFSCGKVLSWWELIPIASFLVARGRCAGCKVKLSWQYPFVEALTGIMFVSVFFLDKPILETTILLTIFSTLLVIAVYDLRHQIIPDGLSALFAILSLVNFLLVVGYAQAIHFPLAWQFLAGPLLFAPFFLLWFVSGGRWIGLGDGKLALGVGWFLGTSLGFSATILAVWVGAGFALVMILWQKTFSRSSSYQTKLSMKSEIPFGPFLILAVFVVYFTQMNFFDGFTTLFLSS